MNYTINKTLIAVLVLAIVVLLTATHVSAQGQRVRGCFQLHGSALPGTHDEPLNLNEKDYYVRYQVDHLGRVCAQHGSKVSYQFFLVKTENGPEEHIPLGKKDTINANSGIVTLTVPGKDWRKGFNDLEEAPGGYIVEVHFDDGVDEVIVGHHLLYTPVEKNSAESIGRDSGGLRPGYITCVVAERGTCGTVNSQARKTIGMRTDTPTETKEITETKETTPTETQKSTTVRVEKDTTETVETDERPTVIAQDDTADQNETADSENTSPAPQLKYPVSKKGRLMSEVNYFG